MPPKNKTKSIKRSRSRLRSKSRCRIANHGVKKKSNKKEKVSSKVNSKDDSSERTPSSSIEPSSSNNIINIGNNPDEYKMNYDKKGYALIINNNTFDDDNNINGTENDIRAIKNFLSILGFEFKIESNKTASELDKIVEKCSKRNYSNYGCFLCVIISHGDINSQVFGTDGESINFYEKARTYFQTNKSLNDKPKLFVIDACRGGNDMLARGSSKSEFDIKPMQIDFLFFYPNIEEYVSYQTQNGSPFIQVIAEVLINNYKNDHLLDMFTKVNNEMIIHNQKNECQAPQIVSTLTKKLYFR